MQPTASPEVLIVRGTDTCPPSLVIMKFAIQQVGAGPSGLILALTLAINGVPLRIIDREVTHRHGAKGAGIMVWHFNVLKRPRAVLIELIQPRTLEIYRYLGLLADIEPVAHRFPRMQLYAPPDGLVPLKTWDMSPYSEPTPCRPIVSITA
jgi:2-polyprenyl-6-methoxyphenol hydroxylase-like FAD-dependent oxidoreductase